FNSVMNDYAETELGYKSDVPYLIWSFENINRVWDWGPAMDGYPQTATQLQSAMAKNKYLKVLVMEGMYDLATPFYASTYTFDHIRLWPELRRNISFADFKGGHMVYNDAPAMTAMKKTLDAWYKDALGR